MNKKRLLISLCSLVIFGCASNQAPVAAPAASAPQAEAPVVVANPTDYTADTPSDSSAAVATVQGNNAAYFDFDKYDVKDQYAQIINFNADYLAAHSSASAKIAGNTDDIGSVEYNLALGQRRADAVKNALIAHGTNTEQLEAVSNGKLMPKFSNKSKDGRAQNRRADIFYNQETPTGYSLDQNQLPVIN